MLLQKKYDPPPQCLGNNFIVVVAPVMGSCGSSWGVPVVVARVRNLGRGLSN
jgi:hypothetical protein